MKQLIIAVLAILTMVSCTDEILPVQNEPPETKRSTKDYSISPEKALANLNEFLEGDEELTRSKGEVSVKEIYPVKYSTVATRSEQKETGCENLIYVANFEDNAGYAVLAADERIPDKVIAITEEGNMDQGIVNKIASSMNPERVIFSGYPTTGPGFFTKPEYGDELFMNPNTVDLYDTFAKDTYVGNFDPTLPEDSGTRSPDNSTNSIDPATEVAGTLCMQYAARNIVELDTTLALPFPGNPPLSGAEPGTYVTTGSWSVKESRSPLLSRYRYWNQHAPFNNLCPTKRHFPFFWRSRTAPAGCFNLAIAKLLAYFKFPASYTHEGYTVDWNVLNSYIVFRDDMPANAKNSAAHLLRGIGEGARSLYFYSGTFTFPTRATTYMKNLGFRYASHFSYNWAGVYNLINDGKPLIIYACPGIIITKSHCWNIDGYKIKQRSVNTTVIDDNLRVISNNTETQECKMTHCDFGRGAKANGYYVSGVFETGGEDAELDYGVGNVSSATNFNAFVHLISYPKPN